MRSITLCALLFALVPLALAQSSEAPYHGHGYFSMGFGKCSRFDCGTLETATFGGEAFLYRGLAAGVEGGYGWINSSVGQGVGVLSVSPAYHFKGEGRSQRVVPFVTAGYTRLFRDFQVGGVNWGGGVTAWAANHVGFRFEVRGYHFSIAGLGTNIVTGRVGVSFR